MWYEVILIYKQEDKSNLNIYLCSSFISLRKGCTYITKNKFNQINKEIMLNYVVKNTSLRK